MQTLKEDVRFALRTLGRQKLLTLVAVITLALGIGLNAAIFSAVSGILWNTLPHPEAARLVAVWGQNQKMGFDQSSISFRESEDYRQARSLEQLAAYRYTQVALTGSGTPQSVRAVESTGEFFDVLGEKAALGRTFATDEKRPGDYRVAVITERLWQREFAGDPNVIGRELKLDGRIHSVIGVMPPGFNFLYSEADVFLPLRLTEEQRTSRDARGMRMLARLAPGASLGQANAELKGISSRIEQAEPQAARGWSARVNPLELDVIDRGARMSIQTMFWAALGVLLIACTNIANLLLARGTLRQRELAIRTALGAGRAHVVRLLLTESVVLSLLGGVLGALFATWAIPVLRQLAPKNFPRLEFVQLNMTVLGYMFLVCLICGIVAGLAPAWLLSRGELARSLHQRGGGGTSSRQRLLHGLVTAEIALAMTLLTVTSLLSRGLVGQLYTDPGFDRTHLITATISLSQSMYPDNRQQAEFFQAAATALARDTRIKSASAVQTVPQGGSNSWSPITVEGRATAPDERNMSGMMIVLPDYFKTMGVPVTEGRDFTTNDKAETSPVALINQTMARHFWPDDPRPVGRRFRMTGAPASDWITVVGIARDVHHQSSLRPARPEMYLPLAQSPSRRMVLLARTHGDPAQAASAVRNAVWSVDRNQPLGVIESMEEMIDRRMAGPRVTVQIVGFVGVLALLLSGIGIYGVLSYLTSQRAREIGVRVALGAVRGDIVRLVLNRGLLLAGAGLAFGIALAAAVVPLMRALLNGIQLYDPASFSASAGALFAVAMVACAFPIVRAMRIDPIRVLRED